jgi:hypothetical protein
VPTGPADADRMPSEVGLIRGGMTRRSEAVSHAVSTLDVTDIDTGTRRAVSTRSSADGGPGRGPRCA